MGNKTTYVPYEKNVNVKHNEYKAPTDESIRFLNEFQEKAIQNIVSSINCDSNICKVVGIVLSYNESFNRCLKCHCKFLLNGTEHQFSFNLKFEYNEISALENEKRLSQLGFGSNERLIKELKYILYEKFAKEIAKILIDNSPEFIRNLNII